MDLELRRQEMMRLLNRYQSQYPVPLTIIDARDLRDMEKGQAICAGCLGLPCRKERKRGYQETATISLGRLYIEQRECARTALERMTAQSLKAGLPECYAAKSWTDYEWSNEDALYLGQWYTEVYPERWLYISGGCGVGKTTLASLIGRELIRRGKQVIFRENQELLNELKASFDKTAETTSELIRKYTTCEVMIIDDVGMGLQSEWGVGILEQVINGRYVRNLRTILTSNYGVEELRARLSRSDEYGGLRIVSRLQEKAEHFEVKGADRRGRVK